MEDFGKRLREARQKKGLKQSDVATVLDCAPTSLTNWENNKVQPSLEVLARLCEVLEINPLDLLGKRYSYDDIVEISTKPVYDRTYEEMIALNFSRLILEEQMPVAVQRLEAERDNRNYISNETGLTPDAVHALTDVYYIDDLFGDERGTPSTTKISPAGLEGLNKLLSSPEGLKALYNIGLYLHAGDYRFADGVQTVRVETGAFTSATGTTNHAFYLTPDMTKAIFRDQLLRLLDEMKTPVKQEELEAAREAYRADIQIRKGEEG